MLNEKEILVAGSNGQLGRQLREEFPGAIFTGRDELDPSSANQLENYDFSGVKTIINAAAWIKVDDAENPDLYEQWACTNLLYATLPLLGYIQLALALYPCA